MYDECEEGFCVDVFAELSMYVESYDYVEVYDGHESGFCVNMYVHM